MFQNREHAGQSLAEKLQEFKNRKDTIVLAIPRGGVVVGRQIADKLSLLFSALVVKKLGAPDNPELAIGALAPDGVRYINFDLALRNRVEQKYLDKEIKEKREEVEERVKQYQISNIKYRIKNNKNIILVDDGIATGATTFAAIKYLKKQIADNREQKIILAVPVFAKNTFNELKSKVERIVALEIPESFNAVGQFYREFPQVSDEEVIKLLGFSG